MISTVIRRCVLRSILIAIELRQVVGRLLDPSVRFPLSGVDQSVAPSAAAYVRGGWDSVPAVALKAKQRQEVKKVRDRVGPFGDGAKDEAIFKVIEKCGDSDLATTALTMIPRPRWVIEDCGCGDLPKVPKGR